MDALALSPATGSASAGGTGAPAVRAVRCYYGGWMVAIAAALCAPAVLARAGMSVVALWPLAGVVLLLMLGHLIYSHVRPVRRIALATGSFAMLIGVAAPAGIVSNAGLRLRRPLIDDLLASVDRACGIDTPALVMLLAGHPVWGAVLNLAYVSTFPLVFAVALWLALREEAGELWTLCFGFASCLLISSVSNTAFPAIGNVPHAHLEQAVAASLPSGSGTYYLSALRSLRDGHGSVLDMRQLQGVVTFPSFHVAMALIVAYAFRRAGPVRWVAFLYSALVVVSTVPIGGHYVVDLIGGALLWAACVPLNPLLRSRNQGAVRAGRASASTRLKSPAASVHA